MKAIYPIKQNGPKDTDSIYITAGIVDDTPSPCASHEEVAWRALYLTLLNLEACIGEANVERAEKELLKKRPLKQGELKNKGI